MKVCAVYFMFLEQTYVRYLFICLFVLVFVLGKKLLHVFWSMLFILFCLVFVYQI